MANHLYLHITWATRDRRPMITSGVTEFLSRFVPSEAQKKSARVLALGIVCDHVHVVLEIPSAFDLPKLIQAFKGGSSRVINADDSITRVGLRWAKGYDARTISPRVLANAIRYVKSQEQRHSDKAIE